jgi:taurine dioxygenase
MKDKSAVIMRTRRLRLSDLTYRHQWAPGDVIMWDNRCTLHYAVHDYGEAPRVMHRTTVAGDVPR